MFKIANAFVRTTTSQCITSSYCSQKPQDSAFFWWPQFTSYGIFKPPFPHWLYWFHDINAIWIQFKHLLEPCSHRMSPRLHPSAIIQSHHDTTLAENPSDRLVHVQFNLFRVGLYGSFLCCQSLENGPMSPMDSWDENTKFEVWHNILS